MQLRQTGPAAPMEGHAPSCPQPERLRHGADGAAPSTALGACLGRFPSTDFNRRDFLKISLRLGALVGLSTAVIVPLARKSRTCAQANDCSACDQFSRCDLPQAVECKSTARGKAP